jgi:hypothetical protein
VDTDDASTSAYFSQSLPATGTSDTAFPSQYVPFTYACPAASHQYTLTVIGDDNVKVSKSVTVVNDGDQQ